MYSEHTLNMVKQFCLANSGDEQRWTNKGTQYHWNRGKDTPTGLINGVVRKDAGTDGNGDTVWSVAGSIKIDADGTVLRFTGIPRKVQKTFEPVPQVVQPVQSVAVLELV